ncbi:MAG: hypothetical protein ACE5I9_11075 [Candidatus Methylomirabilales bacterium]
MRDQQSNLVQSAHWTIGKSREYEFTTPLENADQGDILWKRDQAYMIALLVGPGQEYQGVNEDVWMSDQILIRIATPSTLSMYLPALVGGQDGEKVTPHGSHGH